MKARQSGIFVFLLLVSLLVAGCARGEVSTPVPLASETVRSTEVRPTDTPVPTRTATVIPTNTSTNTPAPKPPAILSDYLDGVKITKEYPFDSLSGWSLWRTSSKIEDGQVILVGENDYNGGLECSQKFDPGEGIIFSFENVSGSEYLFRLDRGTWSTDDYRAFGIVGGSAPKADLEQGANYIGGPYLIGNLSLQKNQVYQIAIALGKEGKFFALIWDPEDPEKNALYRETLGEKWIQRNWNFKIQANKGASLKIDDAQIFSFSAIR